ncbi:MAG: PaaI family thioesterase [Armatimonadota bacterium]|nr:PaaI family thioesterase [Armatimonadota bacterium]MDR7439467.1 PaaI family thioesterase [Armatimonadota bacterium]MDR7562937.1 PaaI family thioesterase [Armatimonadota bacterium]MDR7602922.1 PaaI family thioesterase [Armatimonadota bacterium]
MRADRCFVCGPHNPIGLRLSFTEQDGVLTAEFRPTDLHVGYEGIVHGGILAAVLDDVMANLLYRRGDYALTARMELRFHASVRPGDALRVRGWLEEEGLRLVATRGEILRDGERVCSARAVFVRPREKDRA